MWDRSPPQKLGARMLLHCTLHFNYAKLHMQTYIYCNDERNNTEDARVSWTDQYASKVLNRQRDTFLSEAQPQQQQQSKNLESCRVAVLVCRHPSFPSPAGR